MVLKDTGSSIGPDSVKLLNTALTSADTTSITVDSSHLVDSDSGSIRATNQLFLSTNAFFKNASVLFQGNVDPQGLHGRRALVDADTIFNAIVSMLALGGKLFDADSFFYDAVLAGDNQPQFIDGPTFINTIDIKDAIVLKVNLMEYSGVSMEYNSTTMNYNG